MISTDPHLALPNLIDNDRDPLGLSPLVEDNRQRFLRFMLAQTNDALLPLNQIVEVMQIGLEEIFPIPDMPGCILGVCSWRGETLWLVDLNHLVGYEPLYTQPQSTTTPTVIVVQSRGRSLGLVVKQIDDVDFIDEANIMMEPGLCSPRLEPFVLGYCSGQKGTVLDVRAILDSPLWHSHGADG